LHAVAHAFAAAGVPMPPRVTLLSASVREADPGPNGGQMAGYRGGICVDLTHECGHMCLFGRLAVGCGDIGSQPREAALVCAR